MSQIFKELIDATGVTKNRKESDQDHVKRVLEGVSNLSDKEWEGLSQESQDWFNAAADAVGAKQDIPAFPDAEPEAKEEKKASGRRSSAKAKSAEPKVGDTVTVKTKRGKEITGELVEIDEEVVVLEVDGEEQEFNQDRLESIVVSTAEESKEEEKEEAAAEPKEGDTTTVKTKRGKEITGKIVEIDDEIVVLDADGEEQEFQRSRIESITVAEEKKPAGRRSTSKAKTEEKPAAEKKKVTAADNGGVSATGRMRELILDNMDASRDEIKKMLDKEKITFRDNTLQLVYSDVHKLLGMLKERKMLKA